jgi:hypothetical protein
METSWKAAATASSTCSTTDLGRQDALAQCLVKMEAAVAAISSGPPE